MKIEAIYFSGNDCGVCSVLKPKVVGLLNREFPSIEFTEINIQQQPEKAAQYMVFTVPVLLIQIEGKEYAKFIRSFSISEVHEKLNRVYSKF